jgi:predicted ATPase
LGGRRWSAGLVARIRVGAGATPEARLLTLTGPGGIGKTRRAPHLAGELASDFRDGPAYVLPAAVGDPTLVPVIIARTLDPREEGGRLL